MIIQARAEKGKTLAETLADALAIAKRVQASIEFDFGGVKIRVRPEDTQQKAIARANAAAAIRRPNPSKPAGLMR